MSYEALAAKNRARNREFLKSLPSLNLDDDCQPPPKRPRVKNNKQRPKLETEPTRRSNRLQTLVPISYKELGTVGVDEDGRSPRKVVPRKVVQSTMENCLPLRKLNMENCLPLRKLKIENCFGAIPGIPVGTEFETRMEASRAGIHRPTVSGIHGNSLGCYSLALSGGYEDDKDLGYSFVFTGQGGRDLKGTKANPKNLRTAAQSKDQVLEKGNLSLVKNIEKKLPVRVLRGFKLNSKFAPEEGYRYDGLYHVTSYYETQGLAGFKVFKYNLERIPDQEPAPWSDDFIKPPPYSNQANSDVQEEFL